MEKQNVSFESILSELLSNIKELNELLKNEFNCVVSDNKQVGDGGTNASTNK